MINIKYLIVGVFLMVGVSYSHTPDNYKAVPYVVFDMKAQRPDVLSHCASMLSFPLSNEDIRDVQLLEQQFDHEKNCAGLAATQIGISKQVIVFAAPENPDLKKWRPDFTQAMPKTIWINPSYEGIEEDGFHEDYEGCFSVADVAAPVKRYKKIKYHAYDINGVKLEGIAEGFLARIIQHEIDHVNGILYIDKADPKKILPVETYRAMRKAAMELEEKK